MSQASTSKSSEVRELLRNGQFARYLGGEAISMTGTWMQMMAQAWVMTTLTDKAQMLGMVAFASGIPMLTLTMIGGKCADRFDKRKILITTQVVQIIFAVLIGRLVELHRIQIWHILTASFFLGIASAFEMPAAAAMVPEIVGYDKIQAATAVDRSVFHGTRFIGPALAGLVIGAMGAAWAFYANAVSFLGLIAALLTLHPRPVASAHEEEQRRGSIKDGLRYVWSDQPTLAMISLVVAIVCFVFPVMGVMMPLYARIVLNLGADKMGLLMGISAIGALAGSIILLGIPRQRRRSFMLAGSISGSVALSGMALAQNFYVAAVSLVFLTVGVSTIFGVANTIVQERAPGPMRGRVSAIFYLSFFGLMPFAGLGLPSLADRIGIRNAIFLSSGAFFIVVIYILMGRAHRFEQSPVVQAAPAGVPD